jgi:hypothetical protein
VSGSSTSLPPVPPLPPSAPPIDEPPLEPESTWPPVDEFGSGSTSDPWSMSGAPEHPRLPSNESPAKALPRGWNILMCAFFTIMGGGRRSKKLNSCRGWPKGHLPAPELQALNFPVSGSAENFQEKRAQSQESRTSRRILPRIFSAGVIHRCASARPLSSARRGPMRGVETCEGTVVQRPPWG